MTKLRCVETESLFDLDVYSNSAETHIFFYFIPYKWPTFGDQNKNCFFLIWIGKPFPAAQLKVNCGHEEAFVTWQSSYFGYEQQYAYVQYSTDNIKFVNGSDYIAENNKQEILQITVSDLQDSSVYYFWVNTFNRYGLSSSMSTNCSTGTTQGFCF